MGAPTDTRDAILDAAEQEFASRGYAATTIKHLAAAAGVNSALLYYYFADKETLYREMLRRVLGAFAAEGVRRLDGAASPEAGVRRFVELQMEFMSARPHVPRLIVREMIDHDATHAEVQIAARAIERPDDDPPELLGGVERGHDLARRHVVVLDHEVPAGRHPAPQAAQDRHRIIDVDQQQAGEHQVERRARDVLVELDVGGLERALAVAGGVQRAKRLSAQGRRRRRCR